MRRTAASLVVATALLAGCGGDDGPDARAQVSAYLEEVNTVQRQAAPAFKRANEAYVAFSRDELRGADAVERLKLAERDIAATRDRLERVPAPADARRLRAELLEVLTRNLTLARQTRKLASYSAGSARVTRRLAELDRVLRRDLADRATPEGQAASLARFTRGIGDARRRLERLDVPAVLAPVHGDQLRRLGRIRRVAGDLEDALLARDAREVAVLVKAFRQAGAARPRRELARRAFATYRSRFQELNTAYAAVQRAIADLDRSLD